MSTTTNESMTRASFGFHCVICFEFLDPKVLPPVVLPCGHTFVCISCANRLDKCMECRAPLTTALKPSETLAEARQPTNTSASRDPFSWEEIRAARQRRSVATIPRLQTNATKTPSAFQPAERSFPKNLVLIELIEAAVKREKNLLVESCESEEGVRQSVSAATLPCGIYSVTNENGLSVFDQGESLDPQDDSLSGSSCMLWNLCGPREPNEVAKLHFAQTVEIAYMYQDMAVVARSGGFIPLRNMGDLIKVAGPTDPSVELECRIRHAQHRRKNAARLQKVLDVEEAQLVADMVKIERDSETSPFGVQLSEAEVQDAIAQVQAGKEHSTLYKERQQHQSNSEQNLSMTRSENTWQGVACGVLAPIMGVVPSSQQRQIGPSPTPKTTANANATTSVDPSLIHTRHDMHGLSDRRGGAPPTRRRTLLHMSGHRGLTLPH